MMYKSILVNSFVSLLLILGLSVSPLQGHADSADVEDEAVQPAADEGENLSVEEILNRSPSAEDYGEQPRCIRTRNIRRLDVLDNQHVAIQVSRDEFFLVQFDHRCPGLERGRPVMYEPTTSSRLCVLDGIRGTFNEGFSRITPGARCSIPSFQSISKEQVVLLKDTLKIDARKRRQKQDA